MSFEALLTHHFARAWSRQDVLADRVGDARWDCGLDRGILSFGNGATFGIALLGSFSELTETWLWSWANENVADLPDSILGPARLLREIGGRDGIAEFTTASFSASESECAWLSMLAARMLDMGAYYRAPYSEGAAFLALENDDRFRARTETARIPRILHEAISASDLDPKEMAEGFFREEGYALTTEPDRLIAIRDGDSLVVNFDQAGRLAEITAHSA